MRHLLLLALMAPAAQAQDLLTAAEFDALSQGRRLSWAEFGQVYGVEEYLPGRAVRWGAFGEECKFGHWYPQGEAICFAYENDPTPACWTIWQDRGGTIRAHYLEDPEDTEPVVVEETQEPLACTGPDVGV